MRKVGLGWLCLGVFLVSVGTVFSFEKLPQSAPAPSDNKITPAKIELGKVLYFDKRLSADNTISCQSCHDPNKGGVDGLPTSKGIRGQIGGRNAPTVLNAAFLSVQFWDGREPTLEAQAKGPLTNPIEMGMKDHDSVVEKIKGIKGYHKLFEDAFGKDSIDIDNVAKAIATYERTLITPNSPYDRYVGGDKKALSAIQRRGMARFQSTGCTSCHMGPNFSGPALEAGKGFFMKFPTFPNSKYVKKYDLASDSGRFENTKNEDDKYMWRVPTLRNVEKTGPYFHNGKVKSLKEAVKVMASTQLGKELKDNEADELVAFLKSLTGKLPHQKEPKMPK